MNTTASLIAELRILVGFLGEKGQENWWGSEFYSATAAAFLAPIFNRSLFLAQYQGATAAAAKVHDEVIGVGSIYHLFRLPIELEQTASEVVSNPDFVHVLQPSLTSRETALARLADRATSQEARPGPVSLGSMGEELEAQMRRAAGAYHAAFTAGIQSFPYIRSGE